MKAAVTNDAVYSIVRRMTRAELGAVILGAGYAIPADKSHDSLADCVRSLYQDGTVDSTDIIAEYSAD